jgi:hypothetical protein
METTYYWIGGSTGSTLASRFSWNVPGNWRTLDLGDPLDPYLTVSTATDVPSYRDTVIIGNAIPYLQNFDESKQLLLPTPTSPLLFGGYSGGIGFGGWSAGSYGLTGVTYSSCLRRFAIQGNFGPENEGYNQTGYTFIYPFTHIGLGNTGSDIQTYLKYNKVEGMTFSNWDFLANSLTTNDLYLNIKAEEIIINADSTRAPLPRTGFIGWSWEGAYQMQRYANLRVVDNYGLFNYNEDRIVTEMVLNPVEFRIKLKNSKLFSLTHNQPILWNDETERNDKQWEKNTRNLDNNTISLQNCTVMYVTLKTYCSFSTDFQCLIGNFIYNFNQSDEENLQKKFINFLVPRYTQPTILFNGIFNGISAARALNATKNLNGLTFNNIVVDLSGVTYTRNSFGDLTCTGPLQCRLGSNFYSPGFTFNATSIILNNAGVVFETPANIRNMSVTREYITTVDNMPTNSEIFIQTLKLQDQASFYVGTPVWPASLSFTGWRIGQITNNGYFGGVIFGDDPVTYDAYNVPIGGSRIYGDNNQYFINYGTVSDRNIRSGQVYSSLNELVSIDFINDRPS